MQRGQAIIHIDGAARGNPGPAAYAYTIERRGEPLLEHAELIGRATNNVAEYTALIRVLEKAAELSLKRLEVYSDSELLVRQMNGDYRVKNADLQDLYAQAQHLLRSFESVTLRHVRREANHRTDELCNRVLDAATDRDRAASAMAKGARPAPSGRSRAEPVSDERARADCVACLRSAAKEWSMAGGLGGLQPEQVWEQLWSILQESGLLKERKSH
jgi:ribonuclease HI